ncbi:MAG: hypothetical protein QM775_30240 [Pirellulales bacterium]
MALTGLLTYWCAQYETYANAIKQAGVPPELYTFGDYVRDSCEKMAFEPKNKADKASPLGGWGYLFKFLEMSGFVAGAMVPALIVGGLPYCRRCQKYLKSHRHGFLHSPEAWADVKPLAKELRGETLERILGALAQQASTHVEPLQQGSLADVETLVAGFTSQADNKAAASIKFAVDKCPNCDAHRVVLTMENYAIDKSRVSNIIATIDKIETA